jgi:hypothetical protein
LNEHEPDLDPEAGIYVVFLAIIVVAMLAFAALVIDLGSLRHDRAYNRSAADLAATSAALALSESNLADMAGACQAAWDYMVQNVDDAGGSINCGVFAGTCNPATPARTATGTAGRYTVSITNPVTDLAPDTVDPVAQSGDPTLDGVPCERIAVRVTETRPFAFAKIVGVDSGTTTSRSVGRALASSATGEAVALLVLDPTQCNALTASGQGTIRVKGTGTSPGIIVVDSNATASGGSNGCGNNRYAINASGGNSKIIAEPSASGAPGRIRSYALAPGQGNANAYDPGQVPAKVSPQPLPIARRVTRAPVDDRYKSAVDALAPIYGSGTPAGFSSYGGTPAQPCTVTANLVLTGNVFVNCPGGFVVKGTAAFTGGNVVFAGGIDVQGGIFRVNSGSTTDRVVYVRNGNITKDAQGSVDLRRVFVYLRNGDISLGAGSGSVTWIAPFAGDFEDLSLWSESTFDHDLGGQASLQLDGVFFTPNAHVQFTGQGNFAQLQAQFIADTLDLSGQGELVMQPDPSRVVLIPIVGARLIR